MFYKLVHFMGESKDYASQTLIFLKTEITYSFIEKLLQVIENNLEILILSIENDTTTLKCCGKKRHLY